MVSFPIPKLAYGCCPSFLKLFCASLLLFLSLSAVRAQGGVGSTRGLPSSTGGIHTIQGRVYFPSGIAEKPLKVRLESNVAGANSTSTSGGAFIFTSLVSGTYTVIVDAGDEYETVREIITIYGTGGFEGTVSGQTIVVPVYLRPKGSGAAAANPGLVGVPKPAADLYNKALESSRAGDTKKAIEQLSGAIALYPNFALALNELGVQYLKSAQPDKAVEALSSAVKFMPDAFTPRLNYGIALVNKKNFAEAEKELRLALKKNEASRSAHLYLGIALISQHKLDDAEKELLRAASPGQDDLGLAHYYLGGIYWGKHEYKRAADELEKYLKLVPNAPDAERTRAAIKDLRTKQQ